jgi:rhodanese-related sulfurtransferase
MLIVEAGVRSLIKTTVPAILFMIVLIMCTGCTQSTAPPAAGPTPAATMSPATNPAYTDLTPAQAKELIAAEKDLVIVDVSPYYANGHLPGAISIPLETLDAKISTLDKTKPYLVYCHGDAPSIAGAQKLVDAGFPRVYRLAGNYAAWVGAGYMVIT